MSTSPDLPIPERYQVLETVSDDAVEIVHRCRDRTLGREVLLKQPGAIVRESPLIEAVDERTLREARALAQVDHANVQRLLEVIETPAGVLLVLEPVVGECLADKLERDGRLSSAEVARLGVEMADALAAVHAIGTVHRNVSARTIFLRPDGSACLSGFRLAKFCAQAEAQSTIGEVLRLEAENEGAVSPLLPAYPAPEQFGGEQASARTDLFALGCVLYRAATGEEAFPDMLEHGWSPPKNPQKTAGKVPKELSNTILGCLARSPVGRVQSATALREALRAATPVERSAKPVSSRGVRSFAPFVAVVSVVALGVFFGPTWFGSDVAGGESSPSFDDRGVDLDREQDEPLGQYSATYDDSYALLIGIGDYGDSGFPSLPNATRDVTALEELLESLDKGWVVQRLTEDQATKDGITLAVREFGSKLKKNDRALIFYAGHGEAISEESGWIVPSDGKPPEADPNHMTWLRSDEFAHLFGETSAKHVLVMMDCCYARLPRMRSAGARPYEERYLTRKAHIVMTSGRRNERVQDGRPGGNSPFVTAFIGAIRDWEGPAIMTGDIHRKIAHEFRELNVPHEPQHGFLSDEQQSGEFVFFPE